MSGNIKLPMGIEDFERIRQDGFYYVDKTGLIRDLLENIAYVNLFTRPRRFGKTLNMSMIKHFFEIGSDCTLFDGLEISRETELCDKYQGKFPVISISLKNAEGDTFDKARKKLQSIIGNEAVRFSFLADSGNLNKTERQQYTKLIELNETGSFAMSDELLENSLLMLSRFLQKHYEQKTIILIDEYDVPLDKAYQAGYYDTMVNFIRTLFGQALKTNSSLYFAVLTGCIVSAFAEPSEEASLLHGTGRESIFTGLNNFNVYTIKDVRYREYFGFTDKEVRQMLAYYGFTGQYGAVKDWYDGFTFGKRKDIYNPWSITKYLDTGEFKSYWANTSSNLLVDKLIREGEPDIKIAMEALLCDGQIETEIDEEIIFEQLGDNSVAVWSLLLSTGYLKVVCAPVNESDNIYHLSLTNFEVKRMFRRMIQGWFGRKTTKYSDFIKALLADDVDYMNQYMNQIALKTFSSFDSGKKPSELSEPERFYHGFVLGLMIDLADRYQIKSNRESGFGRYDVMLEPLEGGQPAYVLEFKVRNARREKNLEETVREALRQIDERDYDAELTCKGFPKEKIRHYGFAFEGKRVLIGK